METVDIVFYLIIVVAFGLMLLLSAWGIGFIGGGDDTEKTERNERKNEGGV